MKGLRTLCCALAVAALASATPQRAQASDDLTSSMLAACIWVSGECSEVVFTLSLYGVDSYYVKDVVIQGATGLWAFANVISVTSGGTDLLGSGEWGFAIGSAGLVVLASDSDGDPWVGTAPLQIRAQMSTSSAVAQVNAMTYTANGYTDPIGVDGFWSTNGTVTPEPVTTVLLGTGLLGIAGAGARRRRKLKLESELKAGRQGGLP